MSHAPPITRWSLARVGAVVISVLAACGHDVPRDRVVGDEWQPREEDAGDEDAGLAGSGGAPICRPPITSEPLPARELAMQGATSNGGRTVYASELFATFSAAGVCAPCHTTDRGVRQFTLTQSTFKADLPDHWFERVNASDPADVMPPAAMNETPILYANRTPDDPFVQFVELMREWDARGRPDVFTIEGEGTGGQSPYKFPKALGLSLSNLGSCIPDKALVRPTEDEAAARALDDRFAAVRSFTDLPRSLKDTDVTTFDSETLARHGVIAFAPTYTLWADNAKKIRFIRVPVGDTVRFDADTQSFDIPANTRFYKTFLKPVTDLQGNVRYRKMETRLILSRPDRVRDDGTLEHTAIFATYKWNDEETDATLFSVPYRDLDPTGFQDDLRVYVADERIEDQILRHPPPNLGPALIEAGAHRTYAMPGSDRCVHCHMGSKSFVLGFTPLQINRRPRGEGGVIENAADHELDQLQRMIDYGVISGLTSPTQVTKLEDTQLPRRPRNEHELNAQGYMVGNCSHCHNPRGYPSRREPVLADVLDFEPSMRGGVFQFPLDKFSPRSFRGDAQDIRIPYITPSLYDHPAAVISNPTDGGNNAVALSNKWIALAETTPAQDEAFLALSSLPLQTLGGTPPSRQPDPSVLKFGPITFSDMGLSPGRPLLAPWRSFIYRNVDAPFSYEDGGTIFPRMPLDTPGYDCRVRRLMGEWMVSIPARLKPAPMPELPEGSRLIRYTGLETYDELVGLEEQPYIEVTPDDPAYAEHVALAQERLALFRRSERYFDCPSSDLDAVAPEVASGQTQLPRLQFTELVDGSGAVSEVYDLLSPARHHYPKTDTRNDPGWVIRRPDWPSVLAIDLVDTAKAESGSLDVALTSELTIAAVNELAITPEIEGYLLGERPFGLWLQKPACHDALAAMPTAGMFTGDARPTWMDAIDAPDDAPVYSVSPGAQVFDMICKRCHGPLANGDSALATTISDLTGGRTRVANLRDGVFGPAGMPGSAWLQAFSDEAIIAYDLDNRDEGDNAPPWTPQMDVDARERTARYVAWMGLGGTNAQIPATVLTRLRSMSVLGELPQGRALFKPSPADAANMLTVAKLACQVLMPALTVSFDPERGRVVRESSSPSNNTLQSRGIITRNGVADLWDDLCHFHNAAPVVRVDVDPAKVGDKFYVQQAAPYTPPGVATSDLRGQRYNHIQRSAYPADAWVGNQRGEIERGLSPSNVAPWCLKPTTDSERLEEHAALEARMRQAGKIETAEGLPICPSDFDIVRDGISVADGRQWTIRGAANAGLAVFLYLDALAKGQVQPTVGYDQCEALP